MPEHVKVVLAIKYGVELIRKVLIRDFGSTHQRWDVHLSISLRSLHHLHLLSLRLLHRCHPAQG